MAAPVEGRSTPVACSTETFRRRCHFVRVTDGRCTLLVNVEPGDTKQVLKKCILRTLAACNFPEYLIARDVVECLPEDISIVPLHGSSQKFEPWIAAVRDRQTALFGPPTDTGLLISFLEDCEEKSVRRFVAFGFNAAASLDADKDEPQTIEIPTLDSDGIGGVNTKHSLGTEKPNRLCDKCKTISIATLDSSTGHIWDIGTDSGLDDETCGLCWLSSRKQGDRPGEKVLSDMYTEGHKLADAQFACLSLEPYTLKDPRICARLRYYHRDGRSEKGRMFDLFTQLGDAATEYGIPYKRCLANTGSSDTIKTACTWIRHCLLHRECFGWSRFNAWEQKQHPKRLLDLRAFDDNCRDLQLVDFQRAVHQCAVREPLASIIGDRRLSMLGVTYATVSHCWGGGVSIKTTPSTLGSLKTRVAYEELPKTFKDCADVARALGLRYLWIDALCIIQESPVEWRIESRKMGAIYGGAFLNISADMSSDSSGGCFNDFSTTQDGMLGKSFYVANQLSDGRNSSLWIWDTESHESLTSGSPVIDAVQTAPLASRAWVCQERCLSQRVLHFTSSQVVWECRRGYRSEDKLRTFPLDLASASGHLIQRSEDERPESDRILAWYRDIVQNSYSGRLLSNDADRLPALSGLARYFSRWLSHKYIAGLWFSSPLALMYGLAWRRENESYTRPASFPHPTWSWAAVNSAVAWPDTFEIVNKAVVQLPVPEHSVDFLGSRVCTPLTLEGYLGRARVWPSRLGLTRNSVCKRVGGVFIGFESSLLKKEWTPF